MEHYQNYLSFNKPQMKVLFETQEEILPIIENLLTQKVCAWAGKTEIRNTFDPAISISGVLERHSSLQRYRIVNDDGNYCYFNPENILSLTFGEGHTFRDGAKAVIKLQL